MAARACSVRGLKALPVVDSARAAGFDRPGSGHSRRDRTHAARHRYIALRARGKATPLLLTPPLAEPNRLRRMCAPFSATERFISRTRKTSTTADDGEDQNNRSTHSESACCWRRFSSDCRSSRWESGAIAGAGQEERLGPALEYAL